MSFTADYEDALHARGWVFLQQLPAKASVQLGANVTGAPGGRSGWTPTGSTYELAPLAVRIEQGFTRTIQSVVDQGALNDLAFVERLEGVAESIGLDHGVGGLIAKGVGVPVWVLLVVLLLVAYAALIQAGIVPTFGDLV